MTDTLLPSAQLFLIFLALIWEIGPALTRIAKALESINTRLAEESSEDAPECQHQQSRSAIL